VSGTGRATATPEMFYKKGENLDYEDQDDEHIMSGIDVDDDEGDSGAENETRLLEEGNKSKTGGSSSIINRLKNRTRDSSSRSTAGK